MDKPVRKSVVISAVNLRKGGTLTVLKDCLGYLSTRDDLKVTALVHSRSLCDYPNIDYIEIPWTIKGWFRRLWCEYVTMHKISKSLQPIDLWLSLHDTTPRVDASHRAVYCQTSFPFMKIKARDFTMDAKIPLFAMFTKIAYKVNVHKNSYLVVQQPWLRGGLSEILNYPKEQIIVAPPAFSPMHIANTESKVPLFFYPATPDCHKNFETLCEAAQLLENQIGKGKFKVLITIKGNENRYAKWLFKKWGKVDSIDFNGFLSKDALGELYGKATALVFPSRIETWGLPISEFSPTGKPMILSDLPYAHGAAAGTDKVLFFNPNDAESLAGRMREVLDGTAAYTKLAKIDCAEPYADDWQALFQILLNDENSTTGKILPHFRGH